MYYLDLFVVLLTVYYGTDLQMEKIITQQVLEDPIESTAEQRLSDLSDQKC